MTLDEWQARLGDHFRALHERRGAKPVFALEHGLDVPALQSLQRELLAAIAVRPPSKDHALAWIVYAAEVGYDYEGNEYWQTFEQRTPGWESRDREWVRERFDAFARRYGGAQPSGAWAKNFTIICWPITHAILPKDMQRQLAKLLFDNAAAIGPLADAPLELGKFIQSESYAASSRFKNLAEEPEFMGRIAAALLLDGSSAPDLIEQQALARIRRDLEREQRAAHWLSSAQRSTKDYIALRGLSPAGATHRTPTAHMAAPLRADPRLHLRPDSTRTSWGVRLELPNLAEFRTLVPSAGDTLAKSRCIVEGSAGRPLASGALLREPEPIGLAAWPCPGPLLKFEQPNAEFESELSKRCRLPPGPPWLFHIGADGLAVEQRSLRVRSAESYILVSTDSAPVVGAGSSPVVIACQGVHGTRIDIPEAVSSNDERSLRAMGLEPSLTLVAAPVGIAPAAWDSDGRGVWLMGEAPIISIRANRTLQHVAVSIDDAKSEAVSSLVAGECLFVELPPAGGLDRLLRIRAQDLGGGVIEGVLTLSGRRPRSWSEGTGCALRVIVDPASPTLEQLWQGSAELEVLGPQGRSVIATVELSMSGQPETKVLTLPALSLPVSAEAWRGHFERHILGSAETREAFDITRACVLKLSAAELGAFELRCERELTPLRWVVRHRSGVRELILADDSSAAPSTSFRFSFERPCDLIDTLPPSPPSTGGLFVATKGPHCAALVLGPSSPIKAFSDLGCVPIIPNDSRTTQRAAELATLRELWANATVSGGIGATMRQRTVLNAVSRKIFSILGGESWSEAEASFERSRDPLVLIRAVAAKAASMRLVDALAAVPAHCATVNTRDRIQRLSKLSRDFFDLRPSPQAPAVALSRGVVIRRAGPHTPQWLVEFALRLASDHRTTRQWAAEHLEQGMTQLSKHREVARAARFLVLALERTQVEGQQGWEWR